MHSCYSSMYAVPQHQYSAALLGTQCIPFCSVSLCTPAASRCFLDQSTPVHDCCSSMYPVPRHQYNAALSETKECILCCSVLLCTPGHKHRFCLNPTTLVHSCFSSMYTWKGSQVGQTHLTHDNRDNDNTHALMQHYLLPAHRCKWQLHHCLAQAYWRSCINSPLKR